jgi:hypothetical protein
VSVEIWNVVWNRLLSDRLFFQVVDVSFIAVVGPREVSVVDVVGFLTFS